MRRRAALMHLAACALTCTISNTPLSECLIQKLTFSFPHFLSPQKQDAFLPPGSTVAFGDLRIDVHRSGYRQDFKAPFDDHDRLRSPNRNEDLANSTVSLVHIYASAFSRVGE